MTADYHLLLDATLRHLEDLQRQGTRFLNISIESLNELSAAAVSTPKAPVAASIPVGPQPSRLAAARPPDVVPASSLPAQSDSSGVAGATKPATTSSPLSTAAKEQAMTELRQRAQSCVKCPHLVATRRSVVFGVGSVNAQLMFVGEAPGVDEDAQGEPFVGRAGQLLTRIILTMDLSRETVYIGNILKCRPDTPGQAFGNRKPTPEEMETCIPWLLEQIDLIQPRVLVALGATAVEGLLGRCPSITRMRGQWQTYRGIPLMPTFHPSFLLRPENADKKRLVWEDMLAVMEKLGLPISEKQRGFFRKAAEG